MKSIKDTTILTALAGITMLASIVSDKDHYSAEATILICTIFLVNAIKGKN